MNPIKSYVKFLSRSPLLRGISWALFVIVSIAVFSIVGRKVKRKPVISSIEPQVGVPGDIMTIKGSGFGDTKGSSYVEIAGSKVTFSGYTSWSDSVIKLVIPSNVQDGLVVVGTSSGVSEPGFFANEAGIPVAVRSELNTSVPVITSVTPSTANIGQTISILGSNFGSSMGDARVYFSANREDSSTSENSSSSSNSAVLSNYIPASSLNYDYEVWSDNEIRVRVPDGAASGHIFVETMKGASAVSNITVNFPCGKKNYSSKLTYVIQTTADISNQIATQDSVISIYIPKPAVSSMQPYCELNDLYPEPFITDDPYDIIHRQQLNRIINNKQRYSQTYVVSSYSVKSNIVPRSVGSYKIRDSYMYSNYTSHDSCVPSNDESLISLAQTIIGKEKNPYNQAKLIYSYLISNYKLLPDVRSGDVNVLDLIRKKKGDAYDFAVIFTALCRASGIPALPVGGILVHNKSLTNCHWWSEIYFENYGWFPVDPALGAGLSFEPFSPVENVFDFYFGNIDSQHVAFSRGWRQIKRSQVNSKIVYRPRTYALQSIWEEAGDATSSYSSLWNNPVVQGIY